MLISELNLDYFYVRVCVCVCVCEFIDGITTSELGEIDEG